MNSRFRTKLLAVLAGLFAVAAIAAFVRFRTDRELQDGAMATREALRQQGFKTDLADFNFSTSDQSRIHERALTFFGNMTHPSTSVADQVEFATVGQSNSVIAICKLDWYPVFDEDVAWTSLEGELRAIGPQLDAACDAALDGPIRIDLRAGDGTAMLLKHLAPMRELQASLNARTVLELHAGNYDAAWTNLLASTRLVTAWDPEPVEVSHLVRLGWMTTAHSATWQALQSDHWTERQLADLQHEWEAVDFFKGLPDTVAFWRAAIVDLCQRQRREPLELDHAAGYFLKELFRSPRAAWHDLTSLYKRLRYPHSGSYEDEQALLLFYQQRELELRRAVQSPVWAEMRQLRGVTNTIHFDSRHSSPLIPSINLYETSKSFHRQGRSFLGRAAEAEARRRIIITAIALERYRKVHLSYPSTLQTLVPEFLKDVPVDFMDGKPLRYRLTKEGHFVVYSVGLDCWDDGGRMAPHDPRNPQEVFTLDGVSWRDHLDLVWPPPASAAEVELVHRQRLQALVDEKERDAIRRNAAAPP